MYVGHFPLAFKETSITAALNKSGMDDTNTQSHTHFYLEWIIARQLNNYLKFNLAYGLAARPKLLPSMSSPMFGCS